MPTNFLVRECFYLLVERRDLSNERNTFKSKTIFYHKKTRLKPERATRPIPKRRRSLYATATRPIPKRRRPLYATATRPIPKRRSPLYATATRPIPKRRRPLYATAKRPIPKRRRPLYATATTQILNLSNLLKGSDIKRTSRRTVLLKGSDIKRTSRRSVLLKSSDIKRTSRRSVLLKSSDIKRTSRRTVLLKGSDIKRTSRTTVLLKGSDIKRTSRRTALLKGRNTRTIQLPLRHLKGIGIGMTPLSDWLNVLPRGSGIAGVTELPLPPALKSYRKMCMQHVYSTHVRKGSAQNHSLHMYSMHGDPTVVYSTCSPFSFVTCLLNIGGVILNLMYKKASLSDVLRLQLCMSTETISFSHIATPCMNPNLMH